MNIVIPMAGMGKRMRPHTLSVPKPLIKVAGKPIVERLCEDIVEVCNEKVDEIGFIIGDFGKEVEDRLIEIANRLGAKGRIYYQDEPLGTAHAILCAKESLRGKVTVAFADTLFDAGFKLDTQRDGVIWTHKVKDPSAFGVVKKNSEGIIDGFVEKPKVFVSDEAIIGIYYFLDGENLRQELQYLIDNNINKQGEFQLTDALQNMLDKGLKFVTNDVKEWLDCGNKNATVNTNQRVLELKKDKESLIGREIDLVNSVIIPPCYIAKGTKIINSKVGPHVSIGENTRVEDAEISNSIIQNSCTISKVSFSNSMLGSYVRVENRNTETSIETELNLGDYSEIKL
ncbi:MAG: sugar phosphate nucleotidyltransferase [Bacteroidales bacterium]|jgi:glucose-1-phosphate thymidylyltransferase|nr:sugar phosphate nucleotidyltransferase [Bacteroidales bacterium]MDD4702903.1 sugar phosphate nucleotidyltransferase [Bacteroidales bacterium]MDX9797572.1 sugar phosphate nucleotidyltransferase [Bacteroidales bacterium]